MEGGLRCEAAGTFYGDGSGYAQSSRLDRLATWSLTLETGNQLGPDTATVEHFSRGAVQGWHPTVPRGELAALIRFLGTAAVGSESVGDCKYALDVIQAGVPPKFRSSASGDADLWRIAARAMQMKGGSSSFRFTKVKAHRGRAAAELEGGAAVAHWEGNNRADVLARTLARGIHAEMANAKAASEVEVPGGVEAFLREAARSRSSGEAKEGRREAGSWHS